MPVQTITMPQIAILSVHSFSGRAYSGEKNGFVGPFDDMETASAWVAKANFFIAQEEAREGISVSHCMPQRRVRITFASLQSITTTPQQLVDQVRGCQQQADNPAEVTKDMLASGFLVFEKIYSWNGRRLHGVDYGLVGPFSSQEAAENYRTLLQQVAVPANSRMMMTKQEMLISLPIWGFETDAWHLFLEQNMQTPTR